METTKKETPKMDYHVAQLANYLVVATNDWGFVRVVEALAEMRKYQAATEEDAEYKSEMLRHARILKNAAERMDEVA